MKLGSLFDGSGGFPLAASLCGIEPVWASEVEPYPIAVTRNRFPDMRHLGDVSKIRGDQVEPVDIITFGSPCQDMSIAGKRAGIQHEGHGDEETTRSGLFYEAARIIKEMREATNGEYPRYAVWENVPGAFSSNKGEDFRLVLQTLVQIVEPTAFVPPVPKSGWNYYDLWMGDGWSIAYRTFDAQYWGVPQRRRRIYLVLDLGGQRAGEILFERDGLRGYFAESGAARERTAADATEGTGVCDSAERFVWSIRLDNTSANPYGGDTKSPTIATGTGHGGAANIGVCLKTYCLQGNTIDRNAQQNGCGICEDVAFTLNAVDRHGIVAAGFKAGQSSGSIGYEKEVSPTLSATGSNLEPTVCVAYDARGNGDGKTSSTITGDHENRVTDYTTVVCIQGAVVGRSDTAGPGGCGYRMDGKAYTIDTKQPSVICKRMRGFGDYEQDETASALKARDFKDCTDLIVQDCIVYYIVRRLTPTECARLQGFPDRWGDISEISKDSPEVAFWREVYRLDCEIKGKKQANSIMCNTEKVADWHNKLHADSSEYKMWGNGIALPNALYVMQGICDAAVRDFFSLEFYENTVDKLPYT